VTKSRRATRPRAGSVILRVVLLAFLLLVVGPAVVANGDVLALPIVALPTLGVTAVAVFGLAFWLLTDAIGFGRDRVLLIGSSLIIVLGGVGIAWARSLQNHTHGALAELDLRAAATASRVFGVRDLMETLNQNSIRTMALFGGLLVLAAVAVGAFRSAALLALTMGITGAMVEFLKTSPPSPAARLGLVSRHVTSWPSGHAALQGSLALGIVLWWWAAGLPRPSILAGCLVPVAALMGYSRAFLGIHWLSEVFAGWLVALVATAVVVAADRVVVPRLRVRDPARMMPVLVAGLVAVGVTVVTVHSVHRFRDRGPRFPSGFSFRDFDRSAPPSDPTRLAALDPGSVLDPLPLYTETLLGTNVQPVNLVVVADRDQLQKAFQREGWRDAPVATPKDLAPTFWRGVRGEPESGDPVAPVFYDTRTPDFVLRRSAGGDGEDVLETQAWQLPIRTARDCSVWAVATSRHDRTEWDWTRLFPARLRAPNIDDERDALVRSLGADGRFEDAGRFAFSPEGTGTGPGGSYTTDGEVALLRQPGCR
jgi:membrane-associated phospholipid phosphatase